MFYCSVSLFNIADIVDCLCLLRDSPGLLDPSVSSASMKDAVLKIVSLTLQLLRYSIGFSFAGISLDKHLFVIYPQVDILAHVFVVVVNHYFTNQTGIELFIFPQFSFVLSLNT